MFLSSGDCLNIQRASKYLPCNQIEDICSDINLKNKSTITAADKSIIQKAGLYIFPVTAWFTYLTLKRRNVPLHICFISTK